MIYTVTLNPALDKTVYISDFELNSVNRTENIRIDAGGKGINVSRIITSLGGKTEAWGILGGNSGRFILKRLLEEKIPNNFIFTKGETRTNLKIVDLKNNSYTDINESGEECDDTAINDLLSDLLIYIKCTDTVVFAGSLPKGADKSIYNKWITEFKKKGVSVFLDADKSALETGIDAAPHFIKPNIDELSFLAGKKLDNMNDVIFAANKILTKGVEKVAVTLGDKGSLLALNSGVFYAHPLKVNVKSTVGAGDSFVAAFALAEECGKSPENVLKYAAAVSSAKVMCESVSAPEAEQIEELLGKIRVEKIR